MTEIMEQESKPRLDHRDYIDLFLIFAVLIFIGLLLFAIYIYDKDSFQCLQDPVTYFEQIKNVTCQCRQRQGYDSTPINLNNISLGEV